MTAKVVSGIATFPDSNSTETTKQSIEGMLVFPITSNRVGDITVKITSKTAGVTREATIDRLHVIDFAKLRVNVANSGTIIAGS